jgi:hypothetical protein
MAKCRSGRAALVAMVLASVAPAATLAQALTGLPPHVIDCSPKPFATDVDPDLGNITVTFDRPMGPDTGFTGIRFLGVFPAARDAEATWDATGTVCSLPVVLEPDVTYAVAANTTKLRKFADAAGTPAVSYAWVFATGPRAEADFPPYVVESDPAFGATDADFRVREISVTFSRPVAPGDYSWVRHEGSGEYPGVRGGEMTLSEDRLRATLEVRLSPATTYALGINDLYYCGYKDTMGRPVIPFGWCFRTAD